MSAKIQGGSVYPNPRLSPSGPLLSGEGGPIIQIKFNQLFTTKGKTPTEWDIPVVPLPPSEADVAGATIPNDTAAPTGDILSVTLTNVRKDNVIGVWFSFGISMTEGSGPDSPGETVFALLADDGAGGPIVGLDGATQNVFLFPNGEGGNDLEIGSMVFLGPNPFGATQNVRIYPVAFRLDQNTGTMLVTPANQVALLAAEFAKT